MYYMIFPPIFAYVIFGLIWIMQVVFNIFLITAPLSTFLGIFAQVLLFLWFLNRYGVDDGFKKFSDAKNGKQLKKRFFTKLGGDLIPFVNMFPWNINFIYQQYKQDLKEEEDRENGISDEVEKKGPDMKKVAGMAALAVATGGASLAAEGAIVAEGAVAGEAAMGAEAMSGGAATSEAMSAKGANMWTEKTGAQAMEKQVANKTITEEVSGIKTGQNFEDYNQGIKNYSDFDTYEQDLKEEILNKKEEDEERQRDIEARKIQGIKEQQNLREKMLEESSRKFGENADYTKRLRDKYRENIE